MYAERDPPIKSTATSLDIVEAVHAAGGVTLGELVDRFEMPRSTVHDHLKTLTDAGYLVKEGRMFHVSVRFLNLGGRARADSTLFEVAESEVTQLADDTGEHANLMVEENGRGVFLYKVKGSQSVNLDTYEGKEVDLHTTAMGKAILAEMDRERRDEVIAEHGLEPVTPKTITGRETLENDLDRIRERGYAIDNEERLEGIRCVAAAITTDERVAGAVSVSAPKRRMNGDRFDEEIPSEVLSTANIIEINIQHA